MLKSYYPVKLQGVESIVLSDYELPTLEECPIGEGPFPATFTEWDGTVSTVKVFASLKGEPLLWGPDGVPLSPFDKVFIEYEDGVVYHISTQELKCRVAEYLGVAAKYIGAFVSGHAL
jgi:hypothetical protein